MLNQGVLNLPVNARQALDGLTGARQIALTSRAIGTAGMLQVADSGPDVPAYIRNRIIRPFFSTKPQGTGVGVQFCHGVVRGHQGRLDLIAPEPAQSGLTGVVFRVSMPSTTLHPVARDAPPPIPAAPISARAMVVDDEPDLADLLAKMLQNPGYGTQTASSAVVAQGLIRAGRFDVILSDMRMPDMDGPTAVTHIRREFAPATQPVIVALTAHAMTGDRERARTGGMDDYLTKPLRVEELQRVLARVPELRACRD